VPDKSSYIERLPAILTEARRLKPIPFFRRRDVEILFGLKKRQAVVLMHKAGAIRVSRELAVDQRDMIAWLERAAASPETSREAARRARVIGEIVECKAENAARAVRIVLPDPVPPEGMPEGVSLEPGLLQVRFGNSQELLERLFALARALARDPYQVATLCGEGR